MKYSKSIKDLLQNELKAPSEDFVKYFASRIYNGKVTKRIQEQFQYLVQKSSKQLISDLVSERLKTALTTEEEDTKSEIEEVEALENENIPDENGIITTEEEMEAYRIVQAIFRRVVTLDRVFMRDGKVYCAVILDNNNRKPLCRFWFNGNKKYVGVFDADKNETKHLISSLNDIYNLEELLISTINNYEEVTLSN